MQNSRRKSFYNVLDKAFLCCTQVKNFCLKCEKLCLTFRDGVRETAYTLKEDADVRAGTFHLQFPEKQSILTRKHGMTTVWSKIR